MEFALSKGRTAQERRRITLQLVQEIFYRYSQWSVKMLIFESSPLPLGMGKKSIFFSGNSRLYTMSLIILAEIVEKPSILKNKIKPLAVQSCFSV
jgi:hypothetical protein